MRLYHCQDTDYQGLIQFTVYHRQTVSHEACATIWVHTGVRVLIDYRPALRIRTGVGEWVHSLVAAMAKLETHDSGHQGTDLTIFSSSWKDRLRPSLPQTVSTVDRRIPVRVLNYCWHHLEWPSVELITGKHFDIVHSPHPLLMPTRNAAQLITIHDLDFLDNPNFTEGEVRRDYQSLVKQHAQRATRVLVPSSYTASQVTERLNISVDRIVVCPNGAPAWEPRTTSPPNGHILFVGAIAPRKNIGTLLSAYRELIARDNDCPHLVIAGPVSEKGRPWLDEIKRPPLVNRVTHTGYLTRDLLKDYYDNALLLVLPSFNEGFGLPILEAMALGIPVIGSDRGALPELIGKAGILVNPLEPSDLAAAMEKLINDSTLREKFKKEGFLKAKMYSWENSAKILLNTYGKALST